MKDKVNFKKFGVLTLNEAFQNDEISVGELLEYAETTEEYEAILRAGMTGNEGFVDEYLE